jgi:hypothetical protein
MNKKHYKVKTKDKMQNRIFYFRANELRLNPGV